MKQIQDFFAQFKKTKTEFSVGLDIGNSSVKVVRLLTQTTTKTKELVNFGICSLKSDARKDVVEAVKNVMATANIEMTITLSLVPILSPQLIAM